jgi:hypothetical protein
MGRPTSRRWYRPRPLIAGSAGGPGRPSWAPREQPRPRPARGAVPAHAAHPSGAARRFAAGPTACRTQSRRRGGGAGALFGRGESHEALGVASLGLSARG